MCPVGQNLWVFSKIKFRSNWRLNLQNQVSGFSKSFGLFRLGFLAVVISKIVLATRLAQVSKIGFKIFSQSFGKQAVSFGKVRFCGKGYFLQSQVFKFGFKVFSKSFGKFGSGFLVRFVFSGKFVFFAKSVFSIGFGKSSALAFL